MNDDPHYFKSNRKVKKSTTRPNWDELIYDPRSNPPGFYVDQSAYQYAWPQWAHGMGPAEMYGHLRDVAAALHCAGSQSGLKDREIVRRVDRAQPVLEAVLAVLENMLEDPDE